MGVVKSKCIWVILRKLLTPFSCDHSDVIISVRTSRKYLPSCFCSVYIYRYIYLLSLRLVLVTSFSRAFPTLGTSYKFLMRLAVDTPFSRACICRGYLFSRSWQHLKNFSHAWQLLKVFLVLEVTVFLAFGTSCKFYPGLVAVTSFIRAHSWDIGG